MKELFMKGRKVTTLLCSATLIFSLTGFYSVSAQSRMGSTAQQLEPVVSQIVAEVNANSSLENLAFELLDVVGPRLVGTPGMNKANDWAQ